MRNVHSKCFLIFPTASFTQIILNHKKHLAHVVRSRYSIIPSRILAEAEEDGVDGHPINGNEAVGSEVGEAGGDQDRSPGMRHVYCLRLDPHDLVGNGHRGNHHGKLAQQQDEGAHGVDGGDSQSVRGLQKN